MLTAVIITFLTVGSNAIKFPENWKACNKSDPGLNDCLRGAVEDAVHDLANGSPALGVFPLDPLHFNLITIDQGTGPVSIRLDFRELDVLGLKDIKINKIDTDWKDMEVDTEIPKLILDGQYTITGKVLVLPIVGNGTCKLILATDWHIGGDERTEEREIHNTSSDPFIRSLTKTPRGMAFYGIYDFVGVSNLKYSEQENKGKNYYHLDSFAFKFDVSLLEMQFDNLFNGDKALGANMNIFLNENWKEILHELKPAISFAFGEGFRQIGNRIFSRIPIEEISPE